MLEIAKVPTAASSMNIGEILVWESSSLTPADSRRDRSGDAGALASGEGRFHWSASGFCSSATPARKSSQCLWLRFVALLLAVMAIGFALVSTDMGKPPSRN